MPEEGGERALNAMLDSKERGRKRGHPGVRRQQEPRRGGQGGVRQGVTRGRGQPQGLEWRGRGSRKQGQGSLSKWDPSGH